MFGFPSPQVALVTVAYGEKGFWVVWCNSGEVRLRIIGREILIGMITKNGEVIGYLVVDLNHVTVEWW